MNKKKRPLHRTVMLVLALGLFAGVLYADPTPAGDAGINPVKPPLVVVRANEAATFLKILDTRQAKALGLDRQDYSGLIPGVEARVQSLRAFLAALGYGQAENFWYCLAQKGASLANQAGAMGWDAADEKPAADANQLVKWLDDMGFYANGLDVQAQPLNRRVARLSICQDASARESILNPTTLPPEEWRDHLAEFMAGGYQTLGIWANTRPVLGLLSLLTGIDFRSKMSEHNLGVPVSTQVELFNNQGDCGFELRFNNLLPDDAKDDGKPPLLIHSRDNPLLEMNLPAAGGVYDLLEVDKDLFFIANLNILPLVPRSLNLAVWRKDSGVLGWSLIGLMPEREKFITQLKRLQSWAEYLAVVIPNYKTGKEQSPYGDALWTVRTDDMSLAMGVVDIEVEGQNNALWIVSGSSADWPNPNQIRITQARTPCLVDWTANLDQETKSELAASLGDMTGRNGAGEFDARFFQRLLPDRDSGQISLDGKNLNMISRHGLLPALVPGLMEMFKSGHMNQPAGGSNAAAGYVPLAK